MRNTVICITLKRHQLLFSILLAITCFPFQAKASDNFNNIISGDSSKISTARFIVSFGSICCGINHKKHEEFLKFIGSYKNNIQYTKYPWGEEGEFDYCFTLNELSEKEQINFIKKARKVLGKERTINTYENIACPR